MQQMAINLLNHIASPASPTVYTTDDGAGMPPAVEGFPHVLARLGGGNAQFAQGSKSFDVKGAQADIPDGLIRDSEVAGVAGEDMIGTAFAAGPDTGLLPLSGQVVGGLQGDVNAIRSALDPVDPAPAILVQETGNAVPVLAPTGDAAAIRQSGQAGAPQAAIQIPAATSEQDTAAGFPRSVGASIQAFFTSGGDQTGLNATGFAAAPGGQSGIQPVDVAALSAGGKTVSMDTSLQLNAIHVTNARSAADMPAGGGPATGQPTPRTPVQSVQAGIGAQPIIAAPDAGSAPQIAPNETGKPAAVDTPARPASSEAVARPAMPADGLAEAARAPHAAVPAAGSRGAGFQATGERQSAMQGTPEPGSAPSGNALSLQSAPSAPAVFAGAQASGVQSVAAGPGQGQTGQTTLKTQRATDTLSGGKFAPAQLSDSGSAPQQPQLAPQSQLQPQPQMQPAAGQAAIAPQTGVAPEAGGTAAGSSAPAQQPATPPSPATNMVGLSIARAVADGQTRFTVRLDPPELGRVDIRMEMSGDGAVRAVIRADSQETLDLMQRDARHLERALADSGLKTDSGSLSFSLNQQGQGGRPDGSGQPHGQASADADDTGADGDPAMAQDAESDDEQQSLRLSGLETDSVDITI